MNQTANENEKLVQYGDLVVFEHSSYMGEKIKKGYISALGFMDKRINLIQSKNWQQFQESENQIPLNYRSCVFQITPKLYFDYHHDYYQAKKKYEEQKDTQQSEFLKKRLEKLEKKMAQEKKINQKVIREMRNQYVTYGDEVQLMHHDSAAFMAGEIDSDRNESLGFCCRLLDGFNQEMIFQIHPKFKTH